MWFTVLAVNDREDNYTFIAVFREKGTIGQFVSFVQEYGTNDGKSGGGGGGYIRMMNCLKEQNINAVTYELSNQEIDCFAYMTKKQADAKVRLEFWKNLVEDKIISKWQRC